MRSGSRLLSGETMEQNDYLIIIGFIIMEIGLWLIYEPLPVIVLGLALVALGLYREGLL